MGRQHHDRSGWVVAQRGAQQLHAVELRHAKIRDYEVDVVLSKERQSALSVFRDVNLIPIAGKLC